MKDSLSFDQAMDAETEAEDMLGESNATLFLALYLILLGFFIALSAHSSVSDRRVQAVVDSFHPSIVGAQPGKASALTVQQTEAHLARILGDGLVETNWQLITSDGSITMDIPARRIFAHDSAVIQPRRIGLFRRLAKTITEVEGSFVRLQVEGSGGTTLAGRRAAALAPDLSRFGVSPSRVAVGVASRGDDQLRVSIDLTGHGDER